MSYHDQSKDAWLPISTAPKDIAILVFIPGAAEGMEFEIAHCSSDDPDGDWYCATRDGGFPIDVPPTYWQPLPSTPRTTDLPQAVAVARP